MSVESKISDPVPLRHLDAPAVGVTRGSAGSQQELQIGEQQISKEKVLRLIGPFATEKMGTKMKGLLKGLRYISQIFEPNGKEHEMEIGYPTDVKHVAHIGWDGHSVNTPSWMKEFKATSDFASSPFALPAGTAARESMGPPSTLQESRRVADSQDAPIRGTPGTSKPSRRQKSSSNTPADSPSTDGLDPLKLTRPDLSAGEPSDSPSREPSAVTKPSRRRLKQGSSALDSPTRDSPRVPKQHRHRRPKGEGSARSSSRASKQKASSSALNEEESTAKPSAENQLT